MFSDIVNINTKSHNYELPLAEKDDDTSTDKSLVSTPRPTNRIHIEKPVLDTVVRPPKSIIQKYVFNPNTRVAQYFNVVEYMAREQWAM